MKAAAVFTVAVLGLFLAVLLAAGFAADGSAKVEMARAQGEATIIRAQGQAAMDRAQATQMTAAAASIAMLAAVPWGVLACLGVLGIGVLALAFAAVVNRPQVIQLPPPPPQIIERHIMLLPGGHQAAPDLWVNPTTENYQLIRRTNHG